MVEYAVAFQLFVCEMDRGGVGVEARVGGIVGGGGR